MTNLGLIGIKSIHGRYLQAYSDGVLHCDNDEIHQEETWFLYEVDKDKRRYALRNWYHGAKFISKETDIRPCCPVNANIIGNAEQWVIHGGVPYGAMNAVAIQNLADGTFLGANPPGHNTECGGEVSAGDQSLPPRNNTHWPGWWTLESAGVPTKGKEFFDSAASVIDGIANTLESVAPTVLAALLLL